MPPQIVEDDWNDYCFMFQLQLQVIDVVCRISVFSDDVTVVADRFWFFLSLRDKSELATTSGFSHTWYMVDVFFAFQSSSHRQAF